MSWSVTTESAGHSPDFTALKAEALKQNADCGDQFDAAAAAVGAILSSGCVGSVEKRFAVTMAGHGNPEHAPRGGWANDCITVSLYQL